MIQASMCVTCAGQELTLDIEWKRDVYNLLKKQKLVFFPGEIEIEQPLCLSDINFYAEP